ncbi:uncharacterized protein WM277_018180 [Molossus nigricans]
MDPVGSASAALTHTYVRCSNRASPAPQGPSLAADPPARAAGSHLAHHSGSDHRENREARQVCSGMPPANVSSSALPSETHGPLKTQRHRQGRTRAAGRDGGGRRPASPSRCRAGTREAGLRVRHSAGGRCPAAPLTEGGGVAAAEQPSGRAAAETTAQPTSGPGRLRARACALRRRAGRRARLRPGTRAPRGGRSPRVRESRPGRAAERAGQARAEAGGGEARRACEGSLPLAPTTDSSGSPSSLWEEGAGLPVFPLSDFRRLPGRLCREPIAGHYSQNTASGDWRSKTHVERPIFLLPRMAKGLVYRRVFGTSAPAGSPLEMQPEVPPSPREATHCAEHSLSSAGCRPAGTMVSVSQPSDCAREVVCVKLANFEMLPSNSEVLWTLEATGNKAYLLPRRSQQGTA